MKPEPSGIVSFFTFDMTPQQLKFTRDLLWRLMVTFHMAYAWGYLAWLGIHGFASAEEQKATQAQVAAIRIEQLEARMFDLRIKQCDAIRRGESPRVYTVELQGKIITYRELTGNNPQLPACNEL